MSVFATTATVVAIGGVNQVTDWLNTLSGQWWFLIVILVIAMLDAVVPVVPSETAVIVGGVAAGNGQQWLPAVIAAAAIGAFAGDNTAYMIGHRLKTRVSSFAEHHPKWQKRLDWATTQLRRRGGPLLVTARFIPGGRTAITVASGMTDQPHAWFARWIGVAAVLWATYASLLGYIGGRAFEDNHTAAFGLAFGVAIAATGLIELVRHFLGRKHKQSS